MAIRFIIFFLVGILILFGSHLFLFFSLVRFFSVSSFLIRFYLLLSILFLSISFFIASAWAHWQNNLLSRWLYFASGFWMGLLTNLFLACLILWIIHPFLSRLSSAPWISGLILILAALYSISSAVNAFHPELKEVTVRIKDLPEGWKGRRIIQLSDIHLGHVYRAPFAEKLARTVAALDPELVVITGDLFDGMDGSLAEFIKPLSEIRARQDIFFVTGNHETYLGVEKAFAILEQTDIRILDDAAVNVDGLQLIGYSYPPREEMGADTKDFSETVSRMKGFSPSLPTILLHHAPIDIEAAKRIGVNLQLSGHTHKGQLFPFNFITHWIYKGYDYGLKTEGDYSIYTTNGVGTWGPPMRTGNTPEIVAITLQ